MKWQDKGFLLSSNKYNENSSIVEFFTKDHGKISGILFGSTSKKIKSYLLIGNKFHLNYSSKNENSTGSFKVEIDKVNTALYLDNKLKLSCIIYSIQIIKILTVENQSNVKIFELIENLYKILDDDNWLKRFVIWELDFFKLIGYEISFLDHVEKVTKNNKTFYVSKNDNSKIIPNFLVNNHDSVQNNQEIVNALSITGDFLKKSILNDNDYSLPNSRINFENLIEKL